MRAERVHDRLPAAQAARLASLVGCPPMAACRAQAPGVAGDVVVGAAAAATVHVATWPAGAFERVVLGDRTVTLDSPALPDPGDPDAADRVRELVAAVVAGLAPSGARTHVGLRWPAADAAMRPVLEAAGLDIDAIWSWRVGPASGVAERPGVTVRPARPAEAGAVADLAAEEIRFHLPYSRFTRDLPVGRAWVAAVVREVSSGRPVFVVTVDDVVHGYAVCSVVTTPGDGLPRRAPPGTAGHFLSVGVRAGARGGGLGTSLVTGVQRMLAERGVRRFSAAYVPANPLSSAFWPARGFRPVWTYYAAVVRPD